jgi:hypothetical protein
MVGRFVGRVVLPSRPLLFQGMTRFTIQIGPETRHYVICQTTATRWYDGFGTIEVWRTAGKRIVLIAEDFFEWQTGRYSSGGYEVKTDNVLEDIHKTPEDVAKELAPRAYDK